MDGGKNFSVPVTLNDNIDAITHRFEAIGINARGQIYLAWLDKRDAVVAKNKGENTAASRFITRCLTMKGDTSIVISSRLTTGYRLIAMPQEK